MHRMTLPLTALKASLRLVAAVGLLLVLNHLYGRQLVETLLPLLHRELGWLDDNYRILTLTLATQGADSVIRLDVTLARFVVVGSQVIAPDPRGHAVVSTLASSVLQPAIIGLALLAVWPASRTAQYAWRCLIGLPLLLLMLPLDIPFVLLGELWQVIVASSAQHEFSPLLAWNDFLQQGGRQVLALCASVLVIVLAQWIAPPRATLRSAVQ
jgi:hypothetical protein